MMKEIILDTIIDSIKIIPFLFLAFIIIEYIEHKLKNKSSKIIKQSGKLGPIVGSLLGIFPQCGFSVAATNLYVTRIISLGTLIAVYLSTSDEMLPILIAEHTNVKLIIFIILIKVILGIIYGYIIDILFRKKYDTKTNYDLCKEEHCDCEHSIIISSIKHTLKTFLFVIIATFAVNILFELFSKNLLAKLFMKNNIFGSLLGSLIGLIPSCGASIILTELFISGTIGFGTCVSGLLTGSGVALLVLFKTNKNIKENIFIISLIYLLGSISGIILELLYRIIM